MDIKVNWLAVVLATVVGMICAKTWYMKTAFGPVWRKLTGISEAASQKAGKRPIIITLFANLITAIVLSVLIHAGSVAFGANNVGVALLIGFLTWLAFSATTLVTHNAFELKPANLTWINNGYQLILMLSMSLVIGVIE
ncbi:DUF1761 domain-containing protein [Chitinophaga sp. XS-30]|uniref:DUF1761 domain-containing protein n=1 Tax=Chitinophaga sp. XS-30 TaxID=2604421 RepID=UPI0011DCC646|nr:DUF1761 domain-containing protein [Chitinophaga sp. XS-30]QEH43797.1 DUF1761 domain-containing protein [Chitinophaga sp. XS-30]